MAEKQPEEGYISVVDEEPEIFELLKWDSSHHKQDQQAQAQQPQQITQETQPQVQPQAQTIQELFSDRDKSPERRKPQDSDPFDLSDEVFLESYRLTKDLARSLCEDLKPVMPESTKSIEFSVESKVMAAIAFFANGKYQKSMGGKVDSNITQYFVMSAVSQVTEAMNHANIVKKYIHFPHLKNERDIIKAKFYMKFGIPNVVGSIDCTHVPITKPDEDQKTHFNKSFHSKKVQIICDSDMNIISAFSAPGALTHDTIVDKHPVRVDLESLNSSGEECWLIGWAQYSQKPYLMTPIQRPTKKKPVSPEQYYAQLHTRAHSVVTEAIKHLKSRWKCLQLTCIKQYEPNVVTQMIIACCILHNICNSRGLSVTPMTATEERLEAMKQKVANPTISKKRIEDPLSLEAKTKLITRLWNERVVLPENPKKRASKKERVVENHQHHPVYPPQGQMHHQHPSLISHQTHVIHQHPHQVHQNPQNLSHTPPPVHVEDMSKRPRIVMNNPAYALPLTPGWGHYPQH